MENASAGSSQASPSTSRQKGLDISSKMRRHSGNVPVLPQTKQCPYCEAKFTRTTHLNRHIKTHTREGMVTCELCQAQFTRGDLLSRHKRSCMKGLARRGVRQAPESTNEKVESSEATFAGSSADDLRQCLLNLAPSDPSKCDSTSTLVSPSPSDVTGPTTDLTYTNNTEVAGNAARGFVPQSPGSMFDMLFNDVFSPPTVPSSSSSTNEYEGAAMSNPEMVPFSVPSGQPLPSFNPFTGVSTLLPPPNFAITQSEKEREMEHYEFLFYTEFLDQAPLYHIPTLSGQTKPQILTDTIRACGALFVRTGKASAFTNSVLASEREHLAREFAFNHANADDLFPLVLAVSLLQMIGLFHQNANERATSNLFHGMLVMLIRRAGLLQRNAKWQPLEIDPSNPSSIDAAWRDWARHENMKRALLVSYLHDIMHRASFALPTCYVESEMVLHFPSEPKLWAARTATEWYAVLNEPSAYGSMRNRLMGIPTQPTLAKLRNYRGHPSELDIRLPPMAHLFILKLCLGEIYALAAPYMEPLSEKDKEQRVFEMQYFLHNWVGAWLAGPETPPKEEEPIFYHNALPHYWVAQISLMAYQEDMPPFQSGSASRTDTDARFRLINWWARCVRKFLRSAGKEGVKFGSTVVWDEMMKIRLDAWKFEMEGANPVYDESRDGILDLFANISGRG
ncbi:hypothetical protein PUNSTDRAFT_142219 [Punctularia strigosozonata HHB-11173 SS5]|uniref:uncharacterized protein n=1 Tax=Punctularia strigosozonata (strain HHB-11173) TaxID=741275 RepID=UPI00044170EA|nr:uncharacterized protein PUNSTDRAFT_142219 [Punctularia strigosozonata HHB-11173 SS5]EIN12066.1 hypothetical protein PUNSTDRAFT_142219 [Punctularia strigosozonata HHB-11173 SS5]